MSQQLLVTARDQIDALILSLTAFPKPSYSIDGKSVSWTEYFNALMQQREQIEKLIMMADGPYEIRTQGL